MYLLSVHIAGTDTNGYTKYLKSILTMNACSQHLGYNQHVNSVLTPSTYTQYLHSVPTLSSYTQYLHLLLTLST